MKKNKLIFTAAIFMTLYAGTSAYGYWMDRVESQWDLRVGYPVTVQVNRAETEPEIKGALESENNTDLAVPPDGTEKPDGGGQAGGDREPDESDQAGADQKPDGGNETGGDQKPDGGDQAGGDQKPDGGDQSGGDQKPDGGNQSDGAGMPDGDDRTDENR